MNHAVGSREPPGNGARHFGSDVEDGRRRKGTLQPVAARDAAGTMVGDADGGANPIEFALDNASDDEGQRGSTGHRHAAGGAVRQAGIDLDAVEGRQLGDQVFSETDRQPLAELAAADIPEWFNHHARPSGPGPPLRPQPHRHGTSWRRDHGRRGRSRALAIRPEGACSCCGFSRRLPHGQISALGDGDAKRLGTPVIRIEMIEVAAQAAHLDADDWVALGVETCVAAQDGDREVVGLELLAAASQGLRHHIGEQLPATRRGRKGIACQQLREMRAKLVCRRSRSAVRQRMSLHRSPRAATAFDQPLDPIAGTDNGSRRSASSRTSFTVTYFPSPARLPS